VIPLGRKTGKPAYTRPGAAWIGNRTIQKGPE
jgi:hypothetical protein